MRLHENKQLFRQAVQFTAQQKKIPEIFIEKDYWVTFALYTIFSNPIGAETVFKGGTALLKCFNLLNRFSEDIDLVVLRHENETNNQLKTKIKTITNVVAAILPEVEIKEVTQKMGMNRKTAHTYAKEFQGNYGQVKDVIIVEATWLGYYEPYTTKQVSSFIYEMMLNTRQQQLAGEHGLLPFDVLVLEPKRTLCEKIMSLVRFSYSDEPIEDLKNKIRHTYDLYQMLQEGELQQFFNSKAFDKMILKVAHDDVISFKNNNLWLKHHPKEAMIFSDTENTWNKLKDTYNGDFKNMVFGNLPDDKQVLQTLKNIAERLVLIEWNINFD